jgi:hypothetical protein
MEDKPNNKAEEPAVPYGKRRITIFKSFEEATEADYEFYRNLTPEQRMEIHFKLSVNIFDETKSNSNRRFSF